MKIIKKLKVSLSTFLELTGFISLVIGVGSFSIGLSAIVAGILLITAGSLSA